MDSVVPIEEAAKIYQAARHPKSFISLDRADHLLSNRKDAEYVADLLAIWTGRYL
jgi:putative redox protein